MKTLLVIYARALTKAARKISARRVARRGKAAGVTG